MSIVYLACPYTHPDEAVMLQRYEAVNAAAGELMLQGKVVFSPISHSRPIAEAMDFSTTWDFWKDQDLAMLKLCGELCVLALPGWKDSVGVSEEMAEANRLRIPVTFMEAV
jgi:hypothetical protein